MTPPHDYAPMYGSIADIYDRLDDWIVDNWHEKPVPERVAFLRDWWAKQGGEVRHVLDLCCGTGSVLAELARAGHTVTGLDQSPEMLGYARQRLADEPQLVRAALPEIPLRPASVDAVCSTGAALNYTASEEDLSAVFAGVHRVLRPGGTFVFDILSRHMLTEHAGRQVWAEDQDDFAFVWEFTNPTDEYSDAYYTQFLRQGGPGSDTYVRTRERHRLYVLDPAVIRRSAQRAGLTHTGTLDNYTNAPAHERTLYETWAFLRD